MLQQSNMAQKQFLVKIRRHYWMAILRIMISTQVEKEKSSQISTY